MNANVGKEKIFRIASGASDDDYNWTETLMKNIPMNMLEGWPCTTTRCLAGAKTKKVRPRDFTEGYSHTMDEALIMDELIGKHAAIMDKYDPRKK